MGVGGILISADLYVSVRVCVRVSLSMSVSATAGRQCARARESVRRVEGAWLAEEWEADREMTRRK